ncbi:MAG: hypothetical protein ACKO7P_07810, partial [Bacteroidota bacterium]
MVLIFSLSGFTQINYNYTNINKTTSYFQTLNKSYLRVNDAFKDIPLDQISSAWAYLDFDKDGDDDFIFAAPCYD